MIETHPFGVFIPPQAKYLLLGSFTGKGIYNWFYGTKRNQFWPILETVYQTKLTDKKPQQQLFTQLRLAIADIIYQCERIKGNNLDTNLTNIVYNIIPIQKIFETHNIHTVYFSSRFVEQKFRLLFKNIIEKFPAIVYVTLPSPSPRYAALSLNEKIKIYAQVLPNLYA
ncbi:hypothetical protein A3D85_03485 [Candidatus Amesbacteria bacterium RIFCSPHIGHO2_02_FULL_47_9]|uniref:DNA-deoxyinosine glycosylase n=1 Tax=Candidatus Amesbacteria bacterium RIFCSPHIGHO2_01_FULL_48_32b TaxID=1797253 RepID=A0A1F4YE52_9BACT|nr:MAG: hypothetical protein A2876_02660 [Candidatus Amesbacteria bacterium RIFCSPHIGHO2_01_FULL_48_32b]OGD04763.1 MAG: hypothetical protein A3D85_03485 [Candidatus Amesbacteria bacterium RIFCSPHIGHO2_02_FULL_47_9]OGD08118.1 MAG: hypothetical protein A2899_02105 [Candidatus Amesbacteria bacterium RIFCSPLOWO2_01_FULL_49_25]